MNKQFKVGDRVQFDSHDEQAQPCVTEGVILTYDFPHSFHPDGYCEVVADGRLCFGNGDGYRRTGPATPESVEQLIAYLMELEKEQLAIITDCTRKLRKNASDTEGLGFRMTKEAAERQRHALTLQMIGLRNQQEGLKTVEALKQQPKVTSKAESTKQKAEGRRAAKQ